MPRPTGAQTLAVLLLAGAMAATAWGSKNKKKSGRDPPRYAPPAMARSLYGPPTAAHSSVIRRVRPMGSATNEWRKAPFFFIQTELSPATLYRCTTNYLAFFTHMKEAGHGGPTYAAYATAGTPRVVKAGGEMNGAAMSECWVLVWFAGAEGWNDWDSPWVVYLQKRPRSIRFDSGGLVFRFNGPAGLAVLMPLYGAYKPPQEGKEYLVAHGLPAKNVKPWEWARHLPEDVLRRIRYWANVSREFPIYCEDSFSVDRQRDAVTIRSRFQWVSIEDDWDTPQLKFAPISPVLALASMEGKFPVTYSRHVANPGMFTPYGPYMGIERVDEFDATFYVLKYVHETEASDPPAADAHPTVAAALERLRETARRKFPSADRYNYDHGGMNNFCWAVQGDQWYAKGLPYYDEETRDRALASLQKYFNEDVVVGDRFKEREYPKDSGHSYYILEGPGIGSWGVLGDAGKFSTNLLETLWCYAHFTGDWDLVKKRWDLVKKLFCTPAETTWTTFGRGSIAELGDEAAPCLAFARMAWKVGDMDSYAYGCYMFARELVHHWVKQRGAGYFRLHQPWHTMEFMPEEVYLTNLRGETAGWRIDGPAYPAETGERQYTNRWVRFHNEDVARFYRDALAADVRKEMDLLTERWDPKRKLTNNSHIMPSLVQLRSLLLDESPEDLAKLATPEEFRGPPSGVIAGCMAVLRAGRPKRFERLIPKVGSSPVVAGLERENAGPNVHLTQSVRHYVTPNRKTGEGTIIWPHVTWWTPERGKRWSFGQVRPDPHAGPLDVEEVPLNWNTAVYAYRLP